MVGGPYHSGLCGGLWKKSSGNRNASVSFEIDLLAIGYLKDSTEYSEKPYNTAHKQ